MKNIRAIEEITNFMPPNISFIINRITKDIIYKAEEIRLRLGRPLMICGDGWDYCINECGQPVTDVDYSYFITKNDINSASEIIQNFSAYSFNEELRNGYITIPGGHRIGITGKTVLENENIKTIKDISFINYRIARSIFGAADKVIKYIIDEDLNIFNTIIISPPQCGKTTLIRDMVRQLSDGIQELRFKGKKIGLIDERSEIAACFMGKPRNDVGYRTDVLDACPKAKGIIIMIRSMSPEIIATDEIGKVEDADALLEAVNAGVKVISTIHGKNIDDLYKKAELKRVHNNIFERIIVLNRSQGVGTVEGIYDNNRNVLFKNNYEVKEKCL